MPKFQKILNGMAKGLEGAFERSAGAPLPNQKGVPRQEEIARFLREWLPKRYGVVTSSYALIEQESSNELDVVIYDQLDGWAWPIDSIKGAHAIPFEFVKCIIEVKSTLNVREIKDVQSKMSRFGSFVGNFERPPYFLFAYRIGERASEEFLEVVEYGFGVDAVFTLDDGVYLSWNDKNLQLREALDRGLTLAQAGNDVSVFNQMVARDCHLESWGRATAYLTCGLSKGGALLALACAVSEALEGNNRGLTDALIRWYRAQGEHEPLFPIAALEDTEDED